MGNFIKYCIEDMNESIVGKSSQAGKKYPYFIMLKEYFE